MIVRVAKRRRFTVIDNTAIEDERLSFRALGLLTYLLSKPDEWKANVAHLCERHVEGREAVRSALRDLESLGYVVRRWVRAGGAPVMEYVVFEVAQEPEKQTTMVAQERDDGNLGAQESDASKYSEEQVLREQVLTPPTPPANETALALVQPVQPVLAPSVRSAFERWWEHYPRKVGKLEARKVFPKALKEAGSLQALIAGADRLATDPNREAQYTRHPKTWLNSGGWDDEPLPARNGANGNTEPRGWAGIRAALGVEP